MIEIHDNALTESHREHVYMFSIMTDYKIGWDDTATFEHRQYPCLHHTLTSKEWKELGIIDGLQDKELKHKLTDLSFDEATINLATPASMTAAAKIGLKIDPGSYALDTAPLIHRLGV